MTSNSFDQSDSSQQQPELTEEQLEFLGSLFDWAREGRVQALSSVIDQGIPVDLRNEKDDTFLILASYRGQHEVVDALLERGADVNATNGRGQTALTCAVFLRDEPLVRKLFAAGADPNVGAQSARATVRAMELPGMPELLDELEAERNR